MDRRDFLGLIAASTTLLAPTVRAADDVAALEVLPLWPTQPPGGVPAGLVQSSVRRNNSSEPDNPWEQAIVGITQPTLTVFKPQKPNGAAALMVPGGGYVREVVGKEGYQIAQALSARGVTVFVLLYRLPGDGWTGGADVPLQDGQRALRRVRALAGTYGFDPKRIGVMGFSAGGHLAGMLATRFDQKVYEPVDAVDQQSARPDFAALAYPVATLSAPYVHGGSRDQLLGKNQTPERLAAYSVETGVTANTPPTYLVHAADDKVVPVENSLQVFAALRANKVPAELHVFEEGGHGFGINAGDKPVAAWLDLFWRWAVRHKFF